MSRDRYYLFGALPFTGRTEAPTSEEPFRREVKTKQRFWPRNSRIKTRIKTGKIPGVSPFVAQSFLKSEPTAHPAPFYST
jgi:hypothetical protein